MKKTILFSLLLMMSSFSLQGQSGLRPRGDVNCDWETDIGDIAVFIDSLLLGIEYHPLYTYAYDINNDKSIDIEDIALLIDDLLAPNLQPMPSFSGTLPVLYIITDDYRDVVSKEDYLPAVCWLDAMGIEGFESIGSAQAPLGMQIKGHGNYTWTNCYKKPFRLKFNEKHPVLGMPENRHWVLLANAFSTMGQIENTLPFEIGRRMGMAWNPHMVPVEVVLNGQYIGMYFLTEKIRVDKDRVNIIEQKNKETSPAKVTGGWLLEIDNYIEPDNITFTEGNGKPFWVTPHSPEKLSSVQRDYITNLLTTADSAIYTADKASTAWEQYIDIDSLAIYYIVQEIADNPEAFNGSCYMHKERGDSTRLIFGPIWDCDHSYYRSGNGYQFDKFIYEDIPSNWYSRWIGEIAKFPRFQERVRYHWKRFYEEIFPDIDAHLEDFGNNIGQAGYSDYARWTEYLGNYNIPYRLKHYGIPAFHAKVAWLQSQWGEPTQ